MLCLTHQVKVVIAYGHQRSVVCLTYQANCHHRWTVKILLYSLHCKSLTSWAARIVFMETGPCFNIKMIFPDIGIPIIKIQLSWDCLILIMRILVRLHFYIKMVPKTLLFWHSQCHVTKKDGSHKLMVWDKKIMNVDTITRITPNL